jgi:uncharacterized protein
MSTQNLSSSLRPRNRISSVDVIRGFALFGILFANIPIANDTHSLYQSGSVILGTPQSDNILHIIYQMLIERKFVTIFSILFGFGFYVQMQLNEMKATPFRSYFIRRMLLLLFIGAVHGYLIWNGDIIRNYAICGLFLLLVYRLTAKQIIRMALFFSIAATTVTFILYKAFDLERYNFDTTLFGTQFNVSSYLRYVWINWRTDTFTNFIQATPLTMLFCFGNMLMGFYLGKIGFFQHPEQFIKVRKVLILSGFSIGFICSYLFIQMMNGNIEITPALLWLPFVIVSGLLVQSLGYISLLIHCRQTKIWKRLKNLFEPVGRMALSNYILQSFFYVILFAQWARMLQLNGKLTLTETFLICLILFTIQIFVSKWWLSKFQQGPVEMIWKRWSKI